MNQQINLYQIEELPEPVILTFMHMLQSTVIFIFILLLVTGYKFISCYHYQTEFSSLKDRKNSLSVELEKAQSSIPVKEEKEKLIQQISMLETAAIQMKKMQATLNQLQYNDTKGFSKYLVALAKYNVAELWLTSFKLSSGGAVIKLGGKTTNAENVPKLLQKLGRDPAFEGKTFEVFKIYTEDKEKLIKFTIGKE